MFIAYNCLDLNISQLRQLRLSTHTSYAALARKLELEVQWPDDIPFFCTNFPVSTIMYPQLQKPSVHKELEDIAAKLYNKQFSHSNVWRRTT